jgi:aldehyde dehydrogenase (NAD+)
VQPTVFTGVKESMRGYKEEIFGPVVVIASFATEDEGVDAANNKTYGLSAAVFANDLERAHRVAAEIEVVMVWIKRHARLRSEDSLWRCEAQWDWERVGIDWA